MTNEKRPEEITRKFISTVKQITPSYQRKILSFLAKNPEKKFTNNQVAQALSEDRSNVWRFMNTIIEDAGEDSLIDKIIEEGDVYYRWKEPEITIDGLKLSEILRILENIEKDYEKE